jgi:hypothetical protein
MRTLHQHIRVTFAAGFRVAELSTGFESFCIVIGGLLDISDSGILELVKPFGKVKELRRPIGSTSQMTTRVYFEKTSEAFAALIGLHGKKVLGSTLNVKPGNETNGNRLVFKGTSVRFEWDAPCRTVYMGYSNRRLAEQAIDDARLKPCGDFRAVANIHIGIPAVGAVTVRFLYLPVDVDQDKMKTFGPHQGMVTGKPNIKFTMQDMIRGFRHMLTVETIQDYGCGYQRPSIHEREDDSLGYVRKYARCSGGGSKPSFVPGLYGRNDDFCISCQVDFIFAYTIQVPNGSG